MMSQQADTPILKMTGTPEPKDGRRLVSHQELMHKLAVDPELRACFDLYEQAAGYRLGIKTMIRKQLQHDLSSYQQACVTKRTIDMAAAKRQKR